MAPSSEILITVLLSSLIGSLHCLGMCGGFVALCCFSGDNTQSKTISYISELAYHCMRFISYIFLGFLAGLLGNISSQYMAAAGFQRGFGVFAGIILIVWGLRDIGFFSSLQSRFSGISSLQYFLSTKLISLKIFQYPIKSRGVTRGAFIGLMSGLLPCGWLYAYVLTASTTENALSGMWIMAAFWAGTVPVLFIFARVLKQVNQLWLGKIPKITALFIIALGLMSISGRMTRIEDPSIFRKHNESSTTHNNDENSSTSCH